MLYSLWTIINYLLFIVFIIICIEATKLLREKFGLLVSIIFAFGLLFSGSNLDNKDERQNYQGKKWAFTPADKIQPNGTNYLHITIENNLISTIDLAVLYGKEKSSNNIAAMEANSDLFGFLGGHQWTPKIISINKSSIANQLNYTVTGSLKWKLLGATVYSQNKTFIGKITPKSF